MAVREILYSFTRFDLVNMCGFEKNETALGAVLVETMVSVPATGRISGIATRASCR